ncbi:MAG: hypothetical protein WCV64_01580 [Desulfurivibrionaceae bacterium]
MQLLTELTGRTIEQIEEGRAAAAAGDLMPIKALLYDSALLLHGAALAAVNMARHCVGFPDKNIQTALNSIEAMQKIFVTLAEHDDTNRLSTISGNLFTENLERIMKYIARKGGRVVRCDLLTSRVIQGNAIDYDRHLAALVDAGYLSETHTGRRKETSYMIIPSEQPMLEVYAEAERV